MKLIALLCVALLLSACDAGITAGGDSTSAAEKKRQEDLKKLQEPYKGTIPDITRKNLDVFPQKK